MVWGCSAAPSSSSSSAAASPDVLLGFGFGGTLLALFMRVGGGIFTKAADVGADLVGKVEKDIPEDDPRNAAVIADLVGDNVGDCAGMAADIFESYEVTIVSGLILGLALRQVDPAHSIVWIVYPLIIRAIGVISLHPRNFHRSDWAKTPDPFLRAHDAEESMFRSYEVSSVNHRILGFRHGVLICPRLAAGSAHRNWRRPGDGLQPADLLFHVDKTCSGQGNCRLPQRPALRPRSLLVCRLEWNPRLGDWAHCGLLHLCLPPVPRFIGGVYVLYAIAMIGIGMLSHTGNNVAMDSYGPIADNANGIGEMAWHDMEDEETMKARQIMADLDAVGNTTKAITKGVAIASAVIAAVSLFASFITDVTRCRASWPADEDDPISDTQVFVGLLIGGALPWLFSSFCHPRRQPRGWSDR